MGIETNIQALLHTFEQGRTATFIKRLIVVFLLSLIALMWFGFKFNGFSVPEAMDQAQIGRQLATGQGYTTLYARPLAIHLGLARMGTLDLPLRDVSQAPLGPILNALIFRIPGVKFTLGPGVSVSPAERAITAVSFLFFVGALALSYLLAARLFDHNLALLGIGLILVTDLVWRFAFSGLPQMAMLFFFSAALLALVHAMQANSSRHTRRAVILVLFATLMLSLVTLGNGIGMWIFAGFWIFATIAVRPHWLIGLVTPVLYVIPLLPWAWHNWRGLRNPFGLPFYELFRKTGTDPLAWLADFEPIKRFDIGDFLTNTGEQLLEQASMLFTYFGGSVVACAFFLAVFLHVFRTWLPSQFRWAVFLMWLGAVVGMGVFGVDRAVSVNQLHILFLPVMIFYGLAFLLVLWSRLEFIQPMIRTAFLGLLFLVSATPLLGTLFALPPRVNWPPYLPPLIVRFADWVQPNEAIASDIPWATAWYAGRTSLLLPENIGQFEIIHSEGLLGAPLVGIYLTPFSGDQATYEQIINGRYRDWARFVLREVKQDDLARWMLRSAVNLPIDGQAIFYADRPRWR